MNRRVLLFLLFCSFLPKSSLAETILSLDNAKGIRKNKYVSPKDYGAVGDGFSDDTIPLIKALQVASIEKTTILLDGEFLVKKTLLIGDNVTIKSSGASKSVLKFEPDIRQGEVFYCIVIQGKNVRLDGIDIIYQAPDFGNIDAIPFFGILTTNKSSNVILNRLTVNGSLAKKPGWSHAVRITGNNIALSNSTIINGTMCISIRGENIKVVNNKVSNNLYSHGYNKWTEAVPCWDGIVMEGCTDCCIIGNLVFDCGQSGIYCGGNGSFSNNIKVIDNKVLCNWNRGIDFGVSGVNNSSNGVHNVLVKGNYLSDNRMPQIWLKGVIGFTVEDNTVFISSGFIKRFKSDYQGCFGIKILESVDGEQPSGNIFKTDGIPIKNSY